MGDRITHTTIHYSGEAMNKMLNRLQQLVVNGVEDPYTTLAAEVFEKTEQDVTKHERAAVKAQCYVQMYSVRMPPVERAKRMKRPNEKTIRKVVEWFDKIGLSVYGQNMDVGRGIEYPSLMDYNVEEMLQRHEHILRGTIRQWEGEY